MRYAVLKAGEAFSINEHVFLVSEFSLRYLLIFKDQILLLDFSTEKFTEEKGVSIFFISSDSGTREARVPLSKVIVDRYMMISFGRLLS